MILALIILIHLLYMLVVFCFWKLGKKIFYHWNEIDKINNEIMEENYKNHSYNIETLHRELKVELLHLQAMLIQIPKKDREGKKKKVHPRARTTQEKMKQSIKRKEWWAKKRRTELESESGAIQTIQPLHVEGRDAEPIPSHKSP